jgi:hypothetical protein
LLSNTTSPPSAIGAGEFETANVPANSAPPSIATPRSSM